MNATAVILILSGWLLTTMKTANRALRIRCLLAAVGVSLITVGMASLI